MSTITREMERRNNIESLIIVIFFVILLGVLVHFTLSTPVHRWGDSSSYYMQIVSITDDRDIQYQPVDIRRALLNKFDDLPNGLYLIKNDDGNFFYGKEFSYAFFASPFFALFGNSGILFFNALMFWLMILMGFFYLSKKGNSPLLSFSTSLIFFTVSTAFVYIFWIHAEIYNMFLVMAGIFFWLLYLEDRNDTYLLTAAFVFGLAAVAKLPNCLVFLPFICYELYTRRLKRAVSVLLIFLIPFLLVYGFFYLETGYLSFYGGNRSYYVNQFPFTDGSDPAHEGGFPAFSVTEGRLDVLFNTDVLTKSPYNFFYYFFGRFTGMIWYYPLTVFTLLSFVLGMAYIKKQNNEYSPVLSQIRTDPARSLVFLGIVLTILFYVVIIGNNYLGGGHAVGNRYFYIFPAFLFLIGKVDLRVLAPFIIIALFTVIPVTVHPLVNSQFPEKHTFAFPYTVFPVEYSQIDNLPFWAHTYPFPDYTLYDIDGHSFSGKKAIVVNGTSHWLIKTRTEKQNFTLTLYSDQPGKRQVTLQSGSRVADTVIDDGEAGVVSIPLDRPVYEDTGYKLYSFVLSSSPDGFLIPSM